MSFSVVKLCVCGNDLSHRYADSTVTEMAGDWAVFVSQKVFSCMRKDEIYNVDCSLYVLLAQEMVRRTWNRGNNDEFLTRALKYAQRRKWASLLKAFHTAIGKVIDCLLCFKRDGKCQHHLSCISVTLSASVPDNGVGTNAGGSSGHPTGKRQ